MSLKKFRLPTLQDKHELDEKVFAEGDVEVEEEKIKRSKKPAKKK